jgi:leader peptidase (prepilin peptidase) / N-methyltransferase
VSVALGFIDAKHRRLPDVLTLTSYPAGIAMLGAAAAFLPNGLGFFLHAMLGGAVAGAFYLLLAATCPSALGWGRREGVSADLLRGSVAAVGDPA